MNEASIDNQENPSSERSGSMPSILLTDSNIYQQPSENWDFTQEVRSEDSSLEDIKSETSSSYDMVQFAGNISVGPLHDYAVIREEVHMITVNNQENPLSERSGSMASILVTDSICQQPLENWDFTPKVRPEDTSLEYTESETSSFDDIVQFAGNISVGPLHDDAVIREEAHMITVNNQENPLSERSGSMASVLVTDSIYQQPLENWDFTPKVRFEDTSLAYTESETSSFEYMVQSAGNISMGPLHDDAVIREEAHMITVNNQENPLSERSESMTSILVTDSIYQQPLENWDFTPKVRPGDTSLEYTESETSSFDDIVQFAGNISMGSLLDDAVIREEVQMITLTIAGNTFYQKMESAGSPILPPLLSALQTTLQEFQEKGHELTWQLVRKEACKWLYSFMKDRNKKIAAHPQHIKAIPSNWLLEHGNVYPSEEQYAELETETGLKMKQVTQLFENARKRSLKTVVGLAPNLEPHLKSHFSPKVAETLRKWQSENFGKQPGPNSRQELMNQTNCSERQIVDWFNNHKPGRNRSKKRPVPGQ